ncbi:unnamed protein product [Rotaria sp. Silwood2]|nr:unnamed protein product [Rotaria sp. Silwood2]CAF4494868.1 unnamed protein product [Rotaria sp. Silwood2]
MSLPCSIETCKRPSDVLCYTCRKNLCREHLKEHDDWLNSEVNRLVEEMKNVSTQYMTINRNKLINDFRQKLDKWRDDSYKKIDRIYEEKRKELDQDWTERVTKPQKGIDLMQSKLNGLIRKKKTTHEDINQSTTAIRYIDQQIKEIKQKGIQMNIPTLFLDENLTYVKEPKIEEIDGFQLLSSYRSIGCSAQSGVAFAANNQNILICESDYLNLLNSDLISIQRIPWKYGHIYDMSWSATLTNFIIITDKRIVYLINESSLAFTVIQAIPQEKWWSSTCSYKSLFLSTYGTDANIVQFNLLSSFELIKRWRSPDTCKEHELIHDINYSNETLALIIADSSTKTARLELRSSTTLTQFWSFSLNINHISYQPSIHCCEIKYNEWIVIIENTSNIFHISKDGKLKRIFTYQPSPWNALLFATNILAIRTENNLFLHNI